MLYWEVHWRQRGEPGIISRQSNNGKGNTQTGQLDPRTLLHRRYVIVQTIGHGGMAAVHQARAPRRGTISAIKEMSLSTVPAHEQAQPIQTLLPHPRTLPRFNHPIYHP